MLTNLLHVNIVTRHLHKKVSSRFMSDFTQVTNHLFVNPVAKNLDKKPTSISMSKFTMVKKSLMLAKNAIKFLPMQTI